MSLCISPKNLDPYGVLSLKITQGHDAIGSDDPRVGLSLGLLSFEDNLGYWLNFRTTVKDVAVKTF